MMMLREWGIERNHKPQLAGERNDIYDTFIAAPSARATTSVWLLLFCRLMAAVRHVASDRATTICVAPAWSPGEFCKCFDWRADLRSRLTVSLSGSGCGAIGCLVIDAGPHDLVRVIRDVYVGQHSTPADMRYEKGGCSRRLSPREMEVLALLSEGLRTREISSRLQISGNTVCGPTSRAFATSSRCTIEFRPYRRPSDAACTG